MYLFTTWKCSCNNNMTLVMDQCLSYGVLRDDLLHNLLPQQIIMKFYYLLCICLKLVYHILLQGNISITCPIRLMKFWNWLFSEVYAVWVDMHSIVFFWQCASAIDSLAAFYFNNITAGDNPPSPAALNLARHIGELPSLFPQVCDVNLFFHIRKGSM